MLYWELRHGDVTRRPNSYTIPGGLRLQSDGTYYWRVRRRVQGDGAPAGWSSPSASGLRETYRATTVREWCAGRHPVLPWA